MTGYMRPLCDRSLTSNLLLVPFFSLHPSPLIFFGSGGSSILLQLLQSGGTLTNQLHDKLKDLSQLVSNCLALYSKFTDNNDLFGAPIDNGRRRLLAFSNEPDEYGFPTWMSRKDRELLAAAPIAAPTPGTGLGVQADVVVAADGSGTVRTIAEAIKMAAENSQKRFIILVKAGRTYDIRETREIIVCSWSRSKVAFEDKRKKVPVD